jgi:hypothetical protein
MRMGKGKEKEGKDNSSIKVIITPSIVNTMVPQFLLDSLPFELLDGSSH